MSIANKKISKRALLVRNIFLNKTSFNTAHAVQKFLRFLDFSIKDEEISSPKLRCEMVKISDIIK